jgi:hypothetical protein
VNDSNRDNIISLVKEFRDVFSWFKYDIELKDNSPTQEQQRIIHMALQEKVDEFVEHLLQKNIMTKVPSFPNPDAQQLFDTLGESKHFSKIDLAAGYYKISLAECDREKRAFSTMDEDKIKCIQG